MKNIVAVLVVFVCVCGAVEREPPVIRAELGKPEDTITIGGTKELTVINVTSKSGIGGAKLVRTGDTWPRSITIRLRLGGLESFTMDNGIIRFGTHLKRDKKVNYWKSEYC